MAEIERFHLVVPGGAPVLQVLDLFILHRVEAWLRWQRPTWVVDFSCDRELAGEIALEVSQLVQSAQHGVTDDVDLVRLERAA